VTTHCPKTKHEWWERTHLSAVSATKVTSLFQLYPRIECVKRLPPQQHLTSLDQDPEDETSNSDELTEGCK